MPVPVISVAQMREWEKATWAAKRTPAQVISRVGHIATARAKQLTRPGDLILILAGKGHNGDDARQTGQNLSDREVAQLHGRKDSVPSGGRRRRCGLCQPGSGSNRPGG